MRNDGRTIRTERDMAQATWSAVLAIRKRYNQALKRIGCEPVSFADRSPFEQEKEERR